ncbi:hypothetical protein ABL78_6139 [Leptomonas seymouri]|uniref:Uncharacterized protein n=1 Tax=Leptomonas seymouri TaxID=5684 RepID=A0A0N1IIK0_LEPSE|nr:hypothetical protein ABL78_6139 [Leptomonas seymouri]|eukprot:KPI84811.1 hypothetical protein ABL78_6139 [Leptomonas seymouri]
MFSGCRLRYAVKVVSASLIESLPFTGGSKDAFAYRATLAFHLHRTTPSEPYGVACAFDVAGELTESCFLRSIAPTLAASSSVLSAVLHNGVPASEKALRVLSVDGEVNLSEERLMELMRKGRDTVFQCAVSAVAGGTAGDAADLHAAGAGVGLMHEVEAVAMKRPAKRGRKPKSAGGTPSAADRGDAADMEGEQRDADAVEEAGPKRRGRKPLTGVARRQLKRAQNRGQRVSMVGHEDYGSKASVGSVASADAAQAPEEGMKTLSPMAEARPLSKQRRRRRTKAEMAAARLRMAAEEAHTEPRPLGGESDIWFRRGPEAGVEGVDAPPAAPTPRGHPRRYKAAAATDEDDAAAVAPVKKKRGRKPRPVEETSEHRGPRTVEPATVFEDSKDAEVHVAVVQNAGRPGVEGTDEEDMAL